MTGCTWTREVVRENACGNDVCTTTFEDNQSKRPGVRMSESSNWRGWSTSSRQTQTEAVEVVVGVARLIDGQGVRL